MCLIIDRETHPNNESIILNEDMVVCKVLLPTIKEYTTPFRDMPVTFNQLYTASIKIHRNSRIEEGLHSFKSKTKAMEWTGFIKIFKAIIPKGSEVYYGINGDIVSNQLIITDEQC